LQLHLAVKAKCEFPKVTTNYENCLLCFCFAYWHFLPIRLLQKNLPVVIPRELLLTQQQIKVSGTITDASNNQALPGVNILVKGTIVGAISDVTANFG